MERENLETFTLVWLDNSSVNVEKKASVQRQLRSAINRLRTFQEEYPCEEYLRSLSEDDRIIFVVQGQMGREFIPHIYEIEQIVSIYVFCADKSKHVVWANQYPKIRCVVTQLDQLLNQIEHDQSRRFRCKIDDPLLISIFNESNRSKEDANGDFNFQFVDSQIFLDYLFEIESKSTHRLDLINLLRDEYQGNEAISTQIDQFENDYSPDQAVWWYTHNSFIYRLLTKALRKKNLKILLLLRFLVHDMSKLLDEHRCSKSIRVYRAQRISNNQLEFLKDSIGKLISINAFLWTNLIRKSALSNLKEFSWIDENYQQILFDIEIDIRAKPRKSFANITPISYFKGEQEILFMLGSIFRLVDVSLDANQFWIVRLTLANDQQEDLKNIEHFQHHRDLDPLDFGQLLIDMKLYDQAENYFLHFLQDLEEGDENNEKMILCYDALGTISLEKGQFETSLDRYQKALEMKKERSTSSNDTTVASSYNSLALAHWKRNDYVKAVENYQMALEIFEEKLTEDDPQLSICLNNIALVYRMDHNYLEALRFYERTFSIHQKYLPEDHPDIAMSLTNIAMIYAHLRLYDRALDYYHRSVQIYKRILSSPHSLLAMIYENIGNIYSDKEDLEEALLSYEKAALIYQSLLPFTRCDFLQIQMIMKRLLGKLRSETHPN